MENIINLKNSDYEKIKQNHKLGSGNFSDVYQYDKENIAKLWNDKVLNFKDEEKLFSRINWFIENNVTSSIFLIPKTLLFYQERFVGYLRQAAMGDKLCFSFLADYNLEELYNLLILIENEIYFLTYTFNLKMYDIKFANMIYNKSLDLINIIDTDLYIPSNEENLLQYNLKLLNKSFFFQFFKSQINPYIKNSKIREVLNNINTVNFSDFIECILDNRGGVPIYTFNDIKKYTLK